MRTISAVLFTMLSVHAQGDGRLERVLAKASAAAEEFAVEFPSLACTEKVNQTRLSAGDKVTQSQQSVFDYLVLLNIEPGSFSVDESRMDQNPARKLPAQPLLATTGFAVMVLVFNPQFQPSYRFERLEPELADGEHWERLRFTHESGRSPSVLEVSGREYPLEWKGVAWVHPESGFVRRIEAELRQPLEDIGLLVLKAVVDYASWPGHRGVWLPRRAVIEAGTRHQRWRNTHEFSGYRKFEVNVEQSVGAARQP